MRGKVWLALIILALIVGLGIGEQVYINKVYINVGMQVFQTICKNIEISRQFSKTRITENLAIIHNT